jgi:hypothetical protein
MFFLWWCFLPLRLPYLLPFFPCCTLWSTMWHADLQWSSNVPMLSPFSYELCRLYRVGLECLFSSGEEMCHPGHSWYLPVFEHGDYISCSAALSQNSTEVFPSTFFTAAGIWATSACYRDSFTLPVSSINCIHILKQCSSILNLLGHAFINVSSRNALLHWFTLIAYATRLVLLDIVHYAGCSIHEFIQTINVVILQLYSSSWTLQLIISVGVTLSITIALLQHVARSTNT